MKEEFHLIDQLEMDQFLSRDEWIFLIEHRSDALERYLFEKSEAVRIREYGHDIYIRGLIEFTNYCHNDCYYCGIRKSNPNILRYRLSPSEILSCCHIGYELGFRTFVLQGGEDNWFTTKRMAEIVAEIHSHFPDCAITLSIGERSRESYQALFDAGADRYLLRHETYDPVHYRRLHPDSLSAVHRRKCLWDLKEIGYQIGTGFMVGSPFQTAENLADDLLFLKELNPQMVGIGPFIPHHDTRFSHEPPGTLKLTLFLLGLIRLMIPKVLLPATTALGTIEKKESLPEQMWLCQIFLRCQSVKNTNCMIIRSVPVKNLLSAGTALNREWHPLDTRLLCPEETHETDQFNSVYLRRLLCTISLHPVQMISLIMKRFLIHLPMQIKIKKIVP